MCLTRGGLVGVGLGVVETGWTGDGGDEGRWAGGLFVMTVHGLGFMDLGGLGVAFCLFPCC